MRRCVLTVGALLPLTSLLVGLGSGDASAHDPAVSGPYHYVNPPAELAEDNETPRSGQGRLVLQGTGSRARSISTPDGQILVVFAEGGVARRSRESEVEVRVTPLDPVSLPAAPDRLLITGNAYRVEAKYAASGEPAEMSKPATVVLRYPMRATTLLRLSSGTWRRLESHAAPGSLQLLAETTRLGTFATADVLEPSRTWIVYVSVGVLAGAGGYLVARRRARRHPRRSRQPRRRRPR